MTFKLHLTFIFCAFFCFTPQAQIVYESDVLHVNQLTESVYVHISFLETEKYGKVGCNGMVVINDGEALIFDTPANEPASRSLIFWVEQTMGAYIKAVIPTHFHVDCLGGLQAFHDKDISSFALDKTIALASKEGGLVPQYDFEGKMGWEVGNLTVAVEFLGEGHSPDNVIAYVREEKILFGGCLVKSLGAGKGNLQDANVKAWPFTIVNIMRKYDADIVIPGHGKVGDADLLKYTARLFR